MSLLIRILSINIGQLQNNKSVQYRDQKVDTSKSFKQVAQDGSWNPSRSDICMLHQLLAMLVFY